MNTKRIILVGSAVILALIVAFLVGRHFIVSAPSGLDTARSKASAQNVYMVAIEPEGGTFAQNEMHSWVMTITLPDKKPVKGATIRVFGGMPQHGHGLPTQPQATEIGEGRYRIQGIRFNMAGWWELKFQISAIEGEDDVVFNLAL